MLFPLEVKVAPACEVITSISLRYFGIESHRKSWLQTDCAGVFLLFHEYFYLILERYGTKNPRHRLMGIKNYFLYREGL